MSARSTLASLAALAAATTLIAAVITTTSATSGTAGARPRHARKVSPDAHHLYPDHFPPGPGDDIAARACVICHSAMLVTQQAKDSSGWEKTLALMEKWGAPVAASEHDSLRTYLSLRFGTRPASH